MELRSAQKKKEYQKLKHILQGMGVYEEGMRMQEMRQVFNALQISATDVETSFSENEMQQAIRQSELDFMPSPHDSMMNSTRISCDQSLPQTMVVYAQVHHPMDWSPPNERSSSTTSNSDNSNNNSQELQISSDLLASNASRLHETRGPVSRRRLVDSGINMSNEILVSPDDSNNESQVHQISSDFSSRNARRLPQIPGSFPVRRRIDSGVNIRVDDERPSCSYIGVRKKNTNRLQLPTSSAAKSKKHESMDNDSDDSE